MAGKKFSAKNLIRDRDIELYCQSVEKLLSNINEKKGTKPGKQIFMDDFELIDHDESLLDF